MDLLLGLWLVKCLFVRHLLAQQLMVFSVPLLRFSMVLFGILVELHDFYEIINFISKQLKYVHLMAFCLQESFHVFRCLFFMNFRGTHLNDNNCYGNILLRSNLRYQIVNHHIFYSNQPLKEFRHNNLSCNSLHFKN